MDLGIFEFSVVSLVILFTLFSILRFNKGSSEVKKNSEVCSSPDCIRCSNSYKKRNFADNIANFPWENDSVSLPHAMKEFSDGKTSILHLDFLQSQPIWHRLQNCDSRLARDVQWLTGNHQLILAEYQTIPEAKWTINNSSMGCWQIFSLINQGCAQEDNIKFCPKTFALLSNLQLLLDGCAFGNVFFSVIYPGTFIAEHTGPTNVRIRCHLGLKVPKIDQCYMIVDGIKVGWKNGKCLVFDDSFPHSVTYEKESNGDRAVLCVDLWHPQLTKFHRRAFRSVFGSCEQ